MKTTAFLACAAALMIAACADTDSTDKTGAIGDTMTAAVPIAAPATPGDAAAVDAALSEWAIALAPDSIAAGIVTINIRNTGTAAHAFHIMGTGQDIATDQLEPGTSVSMSLDLVPGEYRVVCPINSAGVKHETRGMTARLRVY